MFRGGVWRRCLVGLERIRFVSRIQGGEYVFANTVIRCIHTRILLTECANEEEVKNVYSAGKGKGSFYIAQYPVRWAAQSALHFLPSLTDLFIPTPFSASPGSILAMQQLRATTKSLTFPPLSIARYSFIQLSRQGRQWREVKCPIFQTVAKGDSNPGSLDCESGILPLSYRAPSNTCGLHYT